MSARQPEADILIFFIKRLQNSHISVCKLAAGRSCEKSFIYHGFSFQPYSFFYRQATSKACCNWPLKRFFSTSQVVFTLLYYVHIANTSGKCNRFYLHFVIASQNITIFCHTINKTQTALMSFKFLPVSSGLFRFIGFIKI